MAKKFTNCILFPNTLDEINFFSLKSDLVSNFGTFLFNKAEGSSEGFLSIIKGKRKLIKLIKKILMGLLIIVFSLL